MTNRLCARREFLEQCPQKRSGEDLFSHVTTSAALFYPFSIFLSLTFFSLTFTVEVDLIAPRPATAIDLPIQQHETLHYLSVPQSRAPAIAGNERFSDVHGENCRSLLD